MNERFLAMQVPKIDHDIGIDVYSTSHDGCGGKIRITPSDFQVFEIISGKALSKIIKESDAECEGNGVQHGYSVYMLEKQNIDTNHALDKILRHTGIKLKALGLKDAHAITQQYVCSMNKSRSIPNFKSNKILLKRIGYTKKPLTKKDMIGNKFRIKISEHNDQFRRFENFDKILNFYGYQRFGSQRAITHLVGKSIIRKNFVKAIDYILTFTSKYDSKENTELRLKLKDKTNYSSILKEMPPQMDIERIIVKEMIKHNEPLRSLRALPVNIRRFYVQAYQSFLFNKTISMAFRRGEELFSIKEGDVCYNKDNILEKYANRAEQHKSHLAVPIIGYSYFKKTRFHYYISKVLEEEEEEEMINEESGDENDAQNKIEKKITWKNFFIKEMQEVSNEGGFRNSAIVCNNFSVFEDIVTFTLSRGSFSTILLREIMKPDDPILAGF